MKTLIRSIAIITLLGGSAEAAQVAFTPGSGGNIGAALDGSGNDYPGSVICGNNTLATIFATVQNCAMVGSSGGLVVDASQFTLSVANPSLGLFGSAGPNTGQAMGANGGSAGTLTPVVQATAGAGISTPGATIQLVAASSGKNIYLAGYNFMAGGTSNVSLESGVSTSFTFSTSGLSAGVLTVTGTPGGTLAVGQTVTGSTIPAFPPTIITSLGSGTGGAGTYNVNNTTTTVGSATLTALTPCVSSVVAVTGAYPLTAQQGVVYGNGFGPIAVLPTSTALCLVSSAAVQISGLASYAQF